MITKMGKRPYRLKRRADARDATRDRIVRAVMELHEELGPAHATISAIAERAGVQRLTVYRHFPDETELFRACTARWLELHAPPDPLTWAGIDDGVARCRAALGALYGYYRTTERMWHVSARDEPEVPALQAPMAAFRAYLKGIADELLRSLAVPSFRERHVVATLAHAVEFSTWASLKHHGLDDAAIAELVTLWVQRAAEAEAPSSKPRGRPVSELAIVLTNDAGEPVLRGTAAMYPAAEK